MIWPFSKLSKEQIIKKMSPQQRLANSCNLLAQSMLARANGDDRKSWDLITQEEFYFQCMTNREKEVRERLLRVILGNLWDNYSPEKFQEGKDG